MTGEDLGRYATDVVLKDGQTVHLRPISSDDLDAMMVMWQRLSAETIRMRFFAPRRMDADQMHYFVDVDHVDRFALVAEQHGEIIGVGRFDRFPEQRDTAEFAILVVDDQQGRGLGTTLLAALMDPASDRGITHFHGDILAENRSMLRVMREAGFQPSLHSYGGTVTATFTTTPTEELLHKAGEQDRRAARAALSSVLAPVSVAVVGASRDPHSVGGLVLANLLRGGYHGPVYPVNPESAFVQSVAAYPTLADCPTVPETIWVCVPAEATEAVIEEAGRLGVRAAVIVSAGFAESGAAGLAIEAAVLRRARSHGIRLLGPNCMGVANTDPDIGLNGTFARRLPRRGNVALSSQSGMLGLTILGAAEQLGLGLSSFASIGNKADISSNDLLQYWEDDPATDVILLYLESFGNPRKFARIARRIGRRKPIVAVKAGGDDEVASATLFDQAGVIRVGTLDAMFNVAKLLATQPLPAGDRIAVLANGGGPGVLAADACRAAGLRTAELGSEARIVVREHGGDPEGPITVHPATPAEAYGEVLRALLRDPGVDGVIAIFIPPVSVDPDAVAEQVVQAVDRSAVAEEDGPPSRVGTPLAMVFMSTAEPPAPLAAAGIPTYVFPESAAEAMGHAARRSAWRRRDLGHVVAFDDADMPAARSRVALALQAARGEVTLTAADANALLAAAGIDQAPSRVVTTVEEAREVAGELAGELGGTLVVKPAAPVEKAELGLVRFGLVGADAVGAAVQELQRQLADHGMAEVSAAGWLVQAMIPDGVEMAVGVRQDQTFGPIIVAGLGGPVAELLGDVSRRIHPLTDVDVDEMLRQLKGYPLLTGYRGAEPVDVGALRVLLLRLAALVEAVPEIRSIDLNPVFVRREGLAVVDSRIHVGRGGPRRGLFDQ
ncbi:bifunctional GNAT family N-acetyltransferase/acetate--CoA ligase family protein [soil metagenome]